MVNWRYIVIVRFSEKNQLSQRKGSMSDFNPNITRRDFLNAVLIGTGAMLLDLPAPARLLAQAQSSQSWEGYGGVGDYAASHGNTEEIVRMLSRIQQGN